jgi:hypothetical protein
VEKEEKEESMSTIKHTKSGYLVWIPYCEDSTAIQYTRKAVLVACAKCKVCNNRNVKRAYVKVKS